MANKKENLTEYEQRVQEKKRNESTEDQSRVPDQQNRMKDKKNLRK